MISTIRVLGFIFLLGIGACAGNVVDPSGVNDDATTTNQASATADLQATPASSFCRIWICDYECHDSGTIFEGISPVQSIACSKARTACAAECDPSDCLQAGLDCE